MLIDTHAHVNFAAFKEDFEAVLARAKGQGVLVVNVGTQMDTSKSAVSMAEKHEGVFAAIGLHPVHTYSQHIDEEESHFQSREEAFDYQAYKELAENPKVVGIGECGLDYYRIKNGELGIKNPDAIKQLQKEAFTAQIKLAEELNKALIIHCRPSFGTQDAYEDILKILDEEARSKKQELRFEIHSFTGSPAIAREFVKRGGYVGLNGIITFYKSGNMKKVAEVVPLEKIVLETDCPYLTPVPHRGKKNEPSFVRFVAECIAKIYNINAEEVAKVTSENARKLFLLN